MVQIRSRQSHEVKSRRSSSCRGMFTVIVLLGVIVLSTIFSGSGRTIQTTTNKNEEEKYHHVSVSQESKTRKEVIAPLVVLNILNDEATISDATTTTTSVKTFSVQQTTDTIPIQQLSIDQMMKQKNDISSPLLLTGWETHSSQNQHKIESFKKQMEKDYFLEEFGNYTQYVKDQFVQPLKDKQNHKCIAPTSSIFHLMEVSATDENLLFFTNDLESPHFFTALREKYDIPEPLDYKQISKAESSFNFFSGMKKGSYHGFHFHDESHIYQIHGRKMWWFAPPSADRPTKANPCHFLTGGNDDKANILPQNVISVLQRPGDTIFVPKGWYHATCAIDDWTVAVGMQRGNPNKLNQNFQPLPPPPFLKENKTGHGSSPSTAIDEKIHPMPWTEGNAFQKKMTECGVKFNWNNIGSWTWFNGDVNKYYNKLIESDSKRNPNDIKSYAVHRWMGKDSSTLIHYELILAVIHQFFEDAENLDLRLLDAGCGLGAGLMWFETNGPSTWNLIGHTISTAQLDFIEKLPSHKFNAVLKSYDDLSVYNDSNKPFDVIYSIEAFIHSPNERHTLQTWSNALADQGLIVIIDDFLSVGVDKNADDIQLFSKAWMGNVLQTTTSLNEIAEQFSLDLVIDRDLGSEYQIIKRNYGNKLPIIAPTETKHHQGWLGSGMRQRLMVEGKLTYRMVVFQKKGGMKSTSKKSSDDKCISVESAGNKPLLKFEPIQAEHRSGNGNDGGAKQQCISGWYCCGKGNEWWENLEEHRTHNTEYLKLPKSLFGDYMEKMTYHLNEFYSLLPSGVTGKFLDIGGTGSVESGMNKVTSKFAHFSGPFDYWVLDSDPAAKGLENALHCDMGNCPEAEDCGYDVTFSHTVLEHSSRPWDVFDTIARITKKGGLTMHLVPFSYQYHATPDDNYRFSHKALTSLLEDRGFEVLDVGYDICKKQEEAMKSSVDEHFDEIWLSYVVGKKL